MAKELAEIEAKLIGALQVEQDAQKIDSALGKVGTTVGGKLKTALGEVRTKIKGLISDGFHAAGVLQTISMANAVEDAKRLDPGYGEARAVCRRLWDASAQQLRREIERRR